ncbi:GDSL-like Lipase/Acylhydrolase [Lachnospiraceae bacterium XBB1006]|nr:GDSL-like Lipase/Acylhydrolase [Lachnospiraceae bacterium XBB1006]
MLEARRMKRLGMIVMMVAALLTVGCGGKHVANQLVKQESKVEAKPVAVGLQASMAKAKVKKAARATKDEKKELSYNFKKPVPEGDKVKKSYFDDALFIGDSRTVGFLQCVDLKKATGYASVGCLVNAALAQSVKLPDGTTTTVAKALKKESFGKVYLMYGVNETGWNYTSQFVKRYRKLIRYVKKTQKDATIYVQSIYPVSQKVSEQSKYISNKRIRQYNKALQKLAAKEKVYFVNMAESVSNRQGALPKDAAVDGIHLRKKYCKRWLRYLRCHTVE